MKTMIQSIRRSLLTAAILGLTAASSEAAAITWGTPTGISGDTDVSTNGSLIGAFNLGSTNAQTTTVNGVTFQAFSVPNNSVMSATMGNFAFSSAQTFSTRDTNGASAAAPFSNLSAPYRTLLSGWIGTFGGPFTLTISGLTVGSQYSFQWWENFSAHNGELHTTATAVNGVTLDTNPTNTEGGLGQFALGSFTADAATETITFNSTDPEGILNGFQVRQVPEPSTWAMLAAGAGSLLALRRRRA